MAEISDYLNGLADQKAQEELKIQIVENPSVDLICEKYEKWLAESSKASFNNLDIYKCAVKLVKELTYTSKDVKDFSIKMKLYENHPEFICSGFFLAALINESKEENFEIITEHLNKDIYYACYSLKKGTVTIFGNVCMPVPQMEGGCVIVKGDVEDIGGRIKKGKLMVEGNLYSGRHFENLELQVEGNFQIEPNCYSNVKIYHKGELVCQN